MQYSQEHLKTMVYVKFVGGLGGGGRQTEGIMGNLKTENAVVSHYL